MAEAQVGDLFPEARNPEGLRVINDRCWLRVQNQHAVVTVSGLVLAHYDLSDRMAAAHAMVNLVEQGWADQNDVARAFDCSARTLRRHQQRFAEGGLAALGQGRGYPRGRARMHSSRRQLIQTLKAQGYGQREIARRIGVSEKAVRKQLRRLGWKVRSTVQGELPLGHATNADPKLSAFCFTPREEPTITQDTDPAHRDGDRLWARLGLLEDAAPLFGSAKAVPGAGVLLAVPVLVASGIFACAQKIYGSLGPAFYGLRTTLLTLLLMALWRLKRPEALKERSPRDLGRVLGLDRAPEVKTLRGKLAKLAAVGPESGASRGAKSGFSRVEMGVCLLTAKLV